MILLGERLIFFHLKCIFSIICVVYCKQRINVLLCRDFRKLKPNFLLNGFSNMYASIFSLKEKVFEYFFLKIIFGYFEVQFERYL